MMPMPMAASTSASLVGTSGLSLPPHRYRRHLHSHPPVTISTRLRNNRFLLSSSLAFSHRR